MRSAGAMPDLQRRTETVEEVGLGACRRRLVAFVADASELADADLESS